MSFNCFKIFESVLSFYSLEYFITQTSVMSNILSDFYASFIICLNNNNFEITVINYLPRIADATFKKVATLL